jgi:DNA-binding CsgD family transcriptional regulator
MEPVPALTASERRVLQLIAEGRTTREIAADLGRAIDTIRTHRKNLMAKLGIHKQTDLVRYAVKEGISKL